MKPIRSEEIRFHGCKAWVDTHQGRRDSREKCHKRREKSGQNRKGVDRNKEKSRMKGDTRKKSKRKGESDPYVTPLKEFGRIARSYRLVT